ncbi:MAG: M81 family metallopeptidase [Oricola sp.]
MKIGVAQFWHEANSFAAEPVGMAAFSERCWLRGDDVAPAFVGSATELGGALAWTAARHHAELLFSRCASATPGGPIQQAVIDRLIAEIAHDPLFDLVDGIYLSLHGASLGTVEAAPEERLVTALRRRFPGLPIVASFDMHACPTEALAEALNGATVYRTYPHVDMAQTAMAALDLLAGMIGAGTRTAVVRRTIDHVLPSFRMATAPNSPMAEIEAIAADAAMGAGAGVLAAFPFASFAYADTPAADAGVLVTCLDRNAGEAVAAHVCEAMSSRRGRFKPDLASAAEVLATKPWDDGCRVAILEPSDNPLSGGAGDTPGLLAAALEAGVPEGTVFAFFHDPALVDRAEGAGIGGRLSATLGGRHGDRFGKPVPVEAEVIALTDGNFVNAGPMEKGRPVVLGRTALFKAGPIRVIVTSVCQAANDVNYFALHGIDLHAVPLLLAKAKNHFLAALGPAFDAVIQSETPGPAMADAAALPFRHVPSHRLNLD